MQQWATLADVLEAWQTTAAPYLRPSTLVTCRRALGWIFGGDLSVACRTSEMRPIVLRWQENWIKRARPGDRESLARVVGSGRSICAQAGSIFAPRWIERYAAAGMRIDDGSARVFRLTWPRAVVAYHPIGAGELQTAWQACAGWRHDERLAFLLALGSGLRASELLGLTVGQLVQRDGVIALRGVSGKGGELCDQPMLEPCGRMVLELWPHHLPATRPVFASASVVRRLNRRLRQCGWKSSHGCHELRSLAICRAATLWGLEGARLFARHTNPALTWTRYGRYLTLFGTGQGAQTPWVQPHQLTHQASPHRDDVGNRPDASLANGYGAIVVNGQMDGVFDVIVGAAELDHAPTLSHHQTLTSTDFTANIGS